MWSTSAPTGWPRSRRKRAAEGTGRQDRAAGAARTGRAGLRHRTWCSSTRTPNGCCRAPPPSPTNRACAMASVSLQASTRASAMSGPGGRATGHRRRRVLRAAGPQRRRQDHDAARHSRPGAPDAGLVRMNGEDVTQAAPAQRDCAFVFQQYSLYPHLSVYRQPGVPVARAHAPQRRRSISGGGWSAWPRRCTSRDKLAAQATACRAARCSAWPSAAPWCASRAST